MKKKIIIAFSGGVDSSVASLILKQKGFDVIAVFMKLFNDPNAEKKARKIAKEIDVPFIVFDFRKEFKDKVINYFIEANRLGFTPNPCVFCNREIKFGIFLEKALKSRPDFFATGHYVKIKDGRIFQPKDKEKDQTYFLWNLKKKHLKKIIFPLEKYKKEEIRLIAKKNNISSWNAPESQEVCFIQKTNKEFLKKHIKNKIGDIVDKNNNVLGSHNGIHFFTIGQRKGIDLSGGPYFVIDKDIKKNKIIVSRDKKDLLKKEVKFKNQNWIRKVSFPIRLKAKIRYGHKPAFGVLNRKEFIFDKPQRAITKGQSIVFYDKKELIGGGIII